jgi:hypothetical protein
MAKYGVAKYGVDLYGGMYLTSRGHRVFGRLTDDGQLVISSLTSWGEFVIGVSEAIVLTGYAYLDHAHLSWTE